FYMMKIIIHGKGKVRFAASEIHDGNLSVFVKLRKDVRYKLQKTVDLSEFIVFCVNDLPVTAHHSQIDKKFHRFSHRENILFLTVVLQTDLAGIQIGRASCRERG